MKEEWKPIEGFEENYTISNLGRVWSKHSHKILKSNIDNQGYLYVWLQQDKRKKIARVHILVLEHFVGPSNGLRGAFKDANPLNVSVDNLKWATISEINKDIRDRQPKKTRCSMNHLLLPSNLVAFELRRGRKKCLACSRARAEIQRIGGDLQEVSDKHYLKIIKLKEVLND